MTPKSKILCLDDMYGRQAEIQRDFPNHEIKHCTDIWSAQSAIKTEKFDLLFLDFDLCGLNMDSAIVTEDAELKLTGADFLAYMFTEVPKENWPDEVIIISINPEGAKELKWLLDQIKIKNSWAPLPN